MKISNHLPHFKSPTLLVVAGKQEGCFYMAENDGIEQIHSIKLKKPQYTDREGHFESRGGNKVFGSGSVYESQDDETVRSFIKQLTTAIDNLIATHKAENIYLFCPPYLANQIEAEMTRENQKLIGFIFFGNYLNQHAFVLLSKIQEQLRTDNLSNKVEPMTKDAFNILKPFNR